MKIHLTFPARFFAPAHAWAIDGEGPKRVTH